MLQLTAHVNVAVRLMLDQNCPSRIRVRTCWVTCGHGGLLFRKFQTKDALFLHGCPQNCLCERL
jgi:hypothetical protein